MNPQTTSSPPKRDDADQLVRIADKLRFAGGIFRVSWFESALCSIRLPVFAGGVWFHPGTLMSDQLFRTTFILLRLLSILLTEFAVFQAVRPQALGSYRSIA
jgi:hypothetical protein